MTTVRWTEGTVRGLGETYHFKAGDAELNQSIIDAVAYVTGKDPLDMEPLYDVVDADALNDLFDQWLNGQVSFRMEGVEVTVTGSDEIIIRDPRVRESIHDQLDGISTVLLLAPADADETCIELLSAAPDHRESQLSVTFARSTQERLQVLDAYTNEHPATGTVISMGEFTPRRRRSQQRSEFRNARSLSRPSKTRRT